MALRTLPSVVLALWFSSLFPLPVHASGPVDSLTLDNGLRVMLHVDRERPFVAVALAYRAGWRDDPEGYSGLAHISEHAFFEGSAHLERGEYEKRLQEVGAAFNATTGPDFTTYFSAGPRGGLKRMLWLEAERMAHALGAVDQASMDHILKTVENERDQRHGHRAHSTQVLFRTLLPRAHPYNAWAIDDYDSIDLNAVRWFVQQHYRPDRAVLSVVGDFDRERAEAWIRELFSPIRPSGEGVERRAAPAVQLRRGERHKWALRERFERTELVWLTPLIYTPGDAEMDVIVSMLGEHMREHLPPDAAIASGAGMLQLELMSMFRLIMRTREDRSSEELAGLGMSVLKSVCNDREAFARARAKRLYRASQRRSLLDRASNLAQRPHWRGAVDPAARREPFERMGFDDMQRACKRWLLDAPRARVRTIFRRMAVGEGRRKSRRVR